MTPEEAEAIRERAFPVVYDEPWRSKGVGDMTDSELLYALDDAQQAKLSAERWYESDEPMDREDRAYAYESLHRSLWRVRDLNAEIAERKMRPKVVESLFHC